MTADLWAVAHLFKRTYTQIRPLLGESEREEGLWGRFTRVLKSLGRGKEGISSAGSGERITGKIIFYSILRITLNDSQMDDPLIQLV